MIRPIFWMGVGAYAALAGKRKVRQAAERYVPKAVAERTVGSVRKFADDVGQAQQHAKQAMQERERQLRDEIDSGTAP